VKRYLFIFDDDKTPTKTVDVEFPRASRFVPSVPIHTIHKAALMISIDLETGETEVLKSRYGREGSVTSRSRGGV